MSERVLVGHDRFHRIVGTTENGNPKVACGSHTQIQRVKVLKRHQAVFKSECKQCFQILKD